MPKQKNPIVLAAPVFGDSSAVCDAMTGSVLTSVKYVRTWKGFERVTCWLLFLFTFGYSTSWATESSSVKGCIAFPAEFSIDQVWGGVRVGFSSIESNDYIYIAYFDQERWLSVAQINKCSGVSKKIRVPSQFGGWDSHNLIALILDGANRLHVAGNMHVSPLVYAHMDVPHELTGLTKLRLMTGADEDKTTYPYFFRFADGALGFSYRSGQSGDGIELLNRLDESGWVRWLDRPLFAADLGRGSVNAYHSGYVLGPDSFFHVAWVWREKRGVQMNFNVNYAKSKDMRTWLDSNGKPLDLPMTPATSEVVDAVRNNSGLLNNVRLGFDIDGRPVVSYLKFDSAGATQLFHARREEAGWQLAPAMEWKYRWDPRGGGTIPSEISFSGVAVRGGRLMEKVRHPELGVKTLEYDQISLKVKQVRGAGVWAAAVPAKNRMVPAGAVLNTRWTHAGNSLAVPRPYLRAISWFSHPADNRDRPRLCKPDGLPCDFSSELILHTVPATPNTTN